MWPKTHRIIDKKLLEHVKSFRCVVCHKTPCDPHHVTTKGAGGGDTPENLMPLCRTHHTEWHSQGVISMYERHLGVRSWLHANGRMEVVEQAREKMRGVRQTE